MDKTTEKTELKTKDFQLYLHEQSIIRDGDTISVFEDDEWSHYKKVADAEPDWEAIENDRQAYLRGEGISYTWEQSKARTMELLNNVKRGEAMTYSLVVRSLAQNEIDEAALYYETGKKEMGFHFREEVDLYIEKILGNPTHFGYRQPPYRKVNLKRFSRFQIIYTIEENTIVVHSVFNTSRDDKKFR